MDGSSIGIIGGADGPTKIFITGNPFPAIIAVAVIVIIVVGAVVMLKMKKHWKAVLWASLLALSVVGFVASIALKRTSTILSFFITILMTGWWLIVEIRKTRSR